MKENKKLGPPPARQFSTIVDTTCRAANAQGMHCFGKPSGESDAVMRKVQFRIVVKSVFAKHAEFYYACRPRLVVVCLSYVLGYSVWT